MTATMTQPTAVQLRELVKKWRREVAANRSKPFRTATEASAYLQMEQCADQVEQLLAAAEPAPEPQGGGEFSAEWLAELKKPAHLPSHREPCSLEFVNWALNMQAIAIRLATKAAPTPKPSTPQADGEVERVRLAIENKIADMACNGEQWADLTNFVNAKFRTLAASKAPAEVTDAGEVFAALDSGEWKIARCQPSSCLTDEANAELAWMVERSAPPFCDRVGQRVWTGPTASEALRRARAALRPTSTTRAGEGK